MRPEFTFLTEMAVRSLIAYDRGYADNCLGLDVDEAADYHGNVFALLRFASEDGIVPPLLTGWYWTGWLDARLDRGENLV